jgi:hypothetical protein
MNNESAGTAAKEEQKQGKEKNTDCDSNNCRYFLEAECYCACVTTACKIIQTYISILYN